MNSLSTFFDSNWNFSGIWNLGNGRNNAYPYFQWQYPDDPKSYKYSGGLGTEQSPFKISHANDLIQLSNTSEDWGAHFEQMEDLVFDLNKQEVDWDGDGTASWDTGDQLGFLPIGNQTTTFTGVYQGNAHTIENLFINRSTENTGLFGRTVSASIENLALINIDIKGGESTGGLIGKSSSSTISKCYITGSIGGTTQVGGFMGFNVASTLKNSYNLGSVNGASKVGGLVGYNEGTVENCYSTASVTGDTQAGGLIGSNGLTVSNSFWDKETSGQAESAGGTGKTTAEMKLISTFTNAGWDFKGESTNGTEDIWNIWNTRNNDYPYFQWQYPDDLQGFRYSGGKGTEESPFKIANVNDLIELSKTLSDMDKYFKQTADIAFNADSSKVDWDGDGTANWDTEDQLGFLPIGNNSTNFIGSYDGGGHSIENLFINRPTTYYCGLFGDMDNYAEIQNLGLININITGSNNVGGLVGYGYRAIIRNCYTTGSVKGKDDVGGIIGSIHHFGGVYDSYSTANVTGIKTSGSKKIGGITGYTSYDVSVSYCYTTGNISGHSQVGGLVGLSISGLISGSYSTSTVSGVEEVGGLIGKNGYSSTIEKSYFVGNVSGTNYVGGLAGKSDDSSGKIKESYNRGSVVGTANYVGGLVGENTGGSTIGWTYNAGSVSGMDFVGGLVGHSDDLSKISNSFWDTESSNQSTSSGGTAKTTLEMKNSATFTNTEYSEGLTTAWSSYNWGFESAPNNGYPYLNHVLPVTPELPLSIKLVSFTAEVKKAKVELAWETASETNNTAFLVYRNEKVIAKIDGAGTTSQAQKYSYLDETVIPGVTYTYVLADVDYANKETKYEDEKVEVTMSEKSLPMTFALNANYPNPFNPSTTLEYGLPEAADVRLNVFDIQGKKVKTWMITSQEAGWHEVIWDGRDMSGNLVSTGIYIYSLQAGEFVSTRKMLFVK